jgi:threonine aldolase
MQDRVAALLGKEASLYMPTATMSNAVAIRTHTSPGDEIVMEKNSHIYIHEGAGYALLSGCGVALVSGNGGPMDPADVAKAIRKTKGSLSHSPNGTLVCVENTCARYGGTTYEQATLDAIAKAAHDAECKVHMDGARLFNAAVASGVSPARMGRDIDSVQICLSKGLGAPLGSCLAGSRELIDRAHRWRKVFGGGMRQAGVVAAAGLFALENNIARLADDHARARRLATAVAAMPGWRVDMERVRSNMMFAFPRSGDLAGAKEALGARGVKVMPEAGAIRAVLHLHITDADVDHAIGAFAEVGELMGPAKAKL